MVKLNVPGLEKLVANNLRLPGAFAGIKRILTAVSPVKVKPPKGATER